MFFINISRTAPSIFKRITVIKPHWWDLSIDTLILKIGTEIRKWPILEMSYFAKMTFFKNQQDYFWVLQKILQNVIFSKFMEVKNTFTGWKIWKNLTSMAIISKILSVLNFLGWNRYTLALCIPVWYFHAVNATTPTFHIIKLNDLIRTRPNIACKTKIMHCYWDICRICMTI